MKTTNPGDVSRKIPFFVLRLSTRISRTFSLSLRPGRNSAEREFSLIVRKICSNYVVITIVTFLTANSHIFLIPLLPRS